MTARYSRRSRSIAQSRLSGPESPILNGVNSHQDDEAAASQKSSRRVIRLTTRSSNARAEKTKTQSQELETVPEEVKEEEEAEEEMKLYERWAEEYYEIVDQLPLELHRTFALMRELESKAQDRIALVASYTKDYRDARLKKKSLIQEQEATPVVVQEYVHPDYGTSSDRDAEGEDVDIFLEADTQDTGQTILTIIDTPPPSSPAAASTSKPTQRTARQSLLRNIARASSEAIRAAEEKVGLAMTAYDWVDRHIRRLDGDLQRSESSLLLGLRAGTEASRGVRDALGISDGDNTFNRKGGMGGVGRAWDDDSMMSNQGTPLPVAGARKKGAYAGNGSLAEMNESSNDVLSATLMADMAIDPNEPRYCYCDQVSSGDMVACDNEDCPREWFHYHCVGLTSPPKGRWYCLFCAPTGFKGSGTFPPDAPCLPPGYGKGGVSSLKASKSGSKKRKR